MTSRNWRRLGNSGLLATAVWTIGLAGSPAAAEPVIEVTRKPEGRFALTLKVQQALGVGEGQRLLLPTARRLCDGLPPQLGRYQFSTNESLEEPGTGDWFVLVQDIECGESEPTKSKPPSRKLEDRERTEIEQDARARAVAYFKALAEGNEQDAQAMFPGFSPDTPVDEGWRSEQADFRAKAGPLGETHVWGVTLYVDPPGAAEPGIYVATDLEVSYENLILCGYFMWHEDPDGTLRINHRDIGEITDDTAAKMTDSQLAKIRTGLRCRPDAEPK